MVGNSKKIFQYDSISDMQSADLEIGNYAIAEGQKYKVYASGGAPSPFVTLNNGNDASISYEKALTAETIGFDQSWNDMTGSRVIDVNYTNNTTKPIIVSVDIRIITVTPTAYPSATLIIDGFGRVQQVAVGGDNTNVQMAMSMIVQPGEDYRLGFSNELVLGNTVSIDKWVEFR